MTVVVAVAELLPVFGSLVLLDTFAVFVGGLVQLQPAAPEFETNVVSLGTASLRLTLVALDGPLLITLTV